MYKLLACDIDGTLLRSDRTISNETIDAINKMKSLGFHFIICTGRPLMGVRNIIDMLGYSGNLITYNGGIIANTNGDILYEELMDHYNSIKAIELGNKYNLTICVWVNDKLYANRLDENLIRYCDICKEPYEIVDSFDELIVNGTNKILYTSSDELTSFIYPKVLSEFAGDATIVKSQPFLIEFMSRKVSKGEGLKKLCEIMGIDIKETIGIGDEVNDISLILESGLGATLDNGVKECKEIASLITPSNDEDGVRHLIENYFLK